MKTTKLLFVVIAMMITVILSGCGGGGSQQGAAPSPVVITNTSGTGTQTDTTEQSSQDDQRDMTGPDEPSTDDISQPNDDTTSDDSNNTQPELRLFMRTNSANSWSTSNVRGTVGDTFNVKVTGARGGETYFRHIVGADGVEYGSRETANSSGEYYFDWKSTCTAIVQTYDTWLTGSDGRVSNHVTEIVAANSSCSAPILQMATISDGPWSSTSVAGYQGDVFYTKVSGLQPNSNVKRHIVGKRDGVDYGDTLSAGPNGTVTQQWRSTCTAIVQSYDIWIEDSMGKTSNHVEETVAKSSGCNSTSASFQYPVDGYAAGSYGGRSFYVDGVHIGEDVLLAEGTPVKAVAAGKIVCYQAADGYGELVVGIQHDLGREVEFNLNVGNVKTVRTRYIVSIYGHLRRSQARGGTQLALGVNSYVNKGDVIGYVNDDAHNGDGTEHLHMGIRLSSYDGTWIFYGYSKPSVYPQSNVKYYGAFSEIIQKL